MNIQRTLTKVKSFLTYDRLFLLAIILVLLCFATCGRQKKDPQTVTQDPEVQIWKDKYGNEHARVETLVLERSQLEAKVDSVAKILKIKPKQVVKYVHTGLRIDTIVQATVDTLEIIRDTSTGKIDTIYALDFVDSSYGKVHLELHAKVPTNPQYLQIGLNADVVVTEYFKRNRILGLRIGKKTYQTDVGTDNPYIRITDVKSIRSKDRPTLSLKMGLGVGINYDPFNHRLSPGIQLGVYLIRSR